MPTLENISADANVAAEQTNPAPQLTPTRAADGWPPVVVAGAYQTGIVLMRNLARRGVRVYAFDCNPAQPGFKSAYGRTHLCPNPDTHPNLWVDFMRDLARKMIGKPVLIASADQFVTAIARHAEELKQLYTFPQAGAATQAMLATKERQYSLAEVHGLPTPRTQYIESRPELESFTATARFPCLIKPLHCRDWETLPEGHPLLGTKLVVAASSAELLAQYDSVSQHTANLVVQEVIAGPDTAKFCYVGVFGQAGKRLGSCVVRQIRTHPIHFGSASVVEPVLDPEIEKLGTDFFTALEYTGICELELKRDTRDGQVKLIEANPRYSVTSDSTWPAGVDIGWLHYLDLIGVQVTPVHQQPADYRHVVLRRDIATFRDYFKARLLTFGGLLQSYRRPVYFFDLDWHDRRVAWDTFTDLTKTLLFPYLRGFLGK